ncbi:MAG: hypothetical protein ACR2PT_23475, partial [Endozoicomonas sp.]
QQHGIKLPDLELYRRKNRHQIKVTVLSDSDSTIETIGSELLVALIGLQTAAQSIPVREP